MCARGAITSCTLLGALEVVDGLGLLVVVGFGRGVGVFVCSWSSDADASSCSLADEGYPLKSMGSISTLAVGECGMVRRSSLLVRGWFVGSGVVMVVG